MRTKSTCAFVLIAVCHAVMASAAQPVPGPALFPPPDPDWAWDINAYSSPWQRPPAFEPPPLAASAEELLPIPDAPAAVRIEQSPAWYRPASWFDDAWDTTIELGLNGSAGTSDTLSLRTGASIKRASPYSRLKLSTHYNRTTKGGTATQNNANFDARNDWLLDEDSPWLLFSTGNVFYDQFQAFDLQTNVNTGVGYRFIKDPDLELIGRLGGGASRKFGGPDERWVPESMLGFEFNQRISKSQKFYGKLDYFPEWDRVGEYRLVADSGWEIALVEPANMSLKLSASDRYESRPAGTNPHLVNYSLMLLVKL